MMHKEFAPNRSIFLATTALEDFWDTSRPLVFLGEWCRRFSRKDYWENLDGRVIESPWDNDEKLYRAYDYVNEVYERLLPPLGNALNVLHGLRYSERYWRILLGPWLLLYIPVVFERYICLQIALETHPDITTTVLAEETFATPCDTLGFVQLVKEDVYNLQIYSRILALSGKNYPKKALAVTSNPFFSPAQTSSWKGRLIRSIYGKAVALSRAFKEGHPVILRDSYFPPAVELRLTVKTRGKIWPILGKPKQVAGRDIDFSKRGKVGNLLPEGNDFEKLLVRMLPNDIPQCFMESYKAVGEDATNIYPARPKAIFSSVAWYYDESFKQWAASSAEGGAMLLGMQHGGNYGSLAFHPCEEHEIAITDRYFSWGWEKTDNPVRVIPHLAAKLSGQRLLGACKRKEGVLFVANTAPRYLLQFPYVTDWFNAYLSWQERFVKAISPYLLAKMRVRLHREDMGWDIAERWHDFCPTVPVEGWDITLKKSLDECRLYVGDQLQTTFLESLSADKPTILFWNPEHYELRPDAQPYYDSLRTVGILHDMPEAAADAVNSVYDDIEYWWNEPARQAARRSFCDRFARTSKDVIKVWAAEFKNIVREGIVGDL